MMEYDLSSIMKEQVILKWTQHVFAKWESC